MNNITTTQVEIISVASYMPKDNLSYVIKNKLDFEKIIKAVKFPEHELGPIGYRNETKVGCLIFQYLRDYSDRQMESALFFNLEAKYFCDLTMGDRVPDHTTICRWRELFGLEGEQTIFNEVNKQLTKFGYIKKLFTFIDATTIVSKGKLWKERDKAIADAEKKMKSEKKKEEKKFGENKSKKRKRKGNEVNEREDKIENKTAKTADGRDISKETKAKSKKKQDEKEKKPTLNNKNVSQYASDKEARFGAKSKNHMWFGYKETAAVDMQTGIILGIGVCPANVPDAEAGLEVLDSAGGATFADKAYNGLEEIMESKGLHPMIIKKNNMKDKNRDLDRYITKMRSPYEGTFSHRNNRTRYRGLNKNKGARIMYAVGYNLRRLGAIIKQEEIYERERKRLRQGA